ncbi:MAG: ribosome silencing factor [Gammaproteobacteria bacterium]
MQTEKILELVLATLDEGKASNIKVIDVQGKTSITDYFVVASGTSERHVKSLADQVVEKLKRLSVQPLGIEGERVGEWVLVDLGDIVLHVMQPRIREFYQLEKLWESDFVPRSAAAAHSA